MTKNGFAPPGPGSTVIDVVLPDPVVVPLEDVGRVALVVNVEADDVVVRTEIVETELAEEVVEEVAWLEMGGEVLIEPRETVVAEDVEEVRIDPVDVLKVELDMLTVVAEELLAAKPVVKVVPPIGPSFELAETVEDVAPDEIIAEEMEEKEEDEREEEVLDKVEDEPLMSPEVGLEEPPLVVVDPGIGPRIAPEPLEVLDTPPDVMLVDPPVSLKVEVLDPRELLEEDAELEADDVKAPKEPVVEVELSKLDALLDTWPVELENESELVVEARIGPPVLRELEIDAAREFEKRLELEVLDVKPAFGPTARLEVVVREVAGEKPAVMAKVEAD